MVLGGCERLYITAWPADDLAEIVSYYTKLKIFL